MNGKTEIPVSLVVYEFDIPPHGAIYKGGAKLSRNFHTKAEGLREIDFLHNHGLIDESEYDTLLELLAAKSLPTGPLALEIVSLN